MLATGYTAIAKPLQPLHLLVLQLSAGLGVCTGIERNRSTKECTITYVENVLKVKKKEKETMMFPNGKEQERLHSERL